MLLCHEDPSQQALEPSCIWILYVLLWRIKGLNLEDPLILYKDPLCCFLCGISGLEAKKLHWSIYVEPLQWIRNLFLPRSLPQIHPFEHNRQGPSHALYIQPQQSGQHGTMDAIFCCLLVKQNLRSIVLGRSKEFLDTPPQPKPELHDRAWHSVRWMLDAIYIYIYMCVCVFFHCEHHNIKHATTTNFPSNTNGVTANNTTTYIIEVAWNTVWLLSGLYSDDLTRQIDASQTNASSGTLGCLVSPGDCEVAPAFTCMCHLQSAYFRFESQKPYATSIVVVVVFFPPPRK